MKTFKDLVFKNHPAGSGLMGQMFFDNGFGISVVRFSLMMGFGYGSYTSDETEWEVAILKGNKEKWNLTYDTPITDDVIGHLTEKEVTKIMKQVQQLKKTK